MTDLQLYTAQCTVKLQQSIILLLLNMSGDDGLKPLVFWNRQFTKEFLELYRDHETLWKVKSRSYTDKVQKDAAYRILVKKIREIDPTATRDDVVKKINNYRSSFRKEVKKTKAAEASGNKYVSRLWYYDLLSFVLDQDASDLEDPLMACDSYETYKPHEETIQIDESSILVKEEHALEPIPQLPQLTKYGLSVQENSVQCSTFDQYSLESSDAPPLLKRSRISNQEFEETAQVIVSNHQLPPELVVEDEFDIQAKLWATDLRKMNPDQQLFAKKAICDILFEGRLGTLDRYSVTINNAHRTSSANYSETSS